jgi:hypothetical protein
LSGAILGLILAVLSLVAVMMILNLFVTPLYTGMPTDQVIAMLPTLLLPFNLIKGTVNAALVLILYKPIRRAMQATRLLPRSHQIPEENHPTARKKRIWVSIAVSIAGLALLAGAIAVFVLVLHGHIEI